MSINVAKTIPLGPVNAYWNNVRLGSPKTQATVRYSKETIQAGIEDVGLNVMSHKTKEICEVDVIVADMKPEQMRYAFDQVASYDARATISTVPYDESTSTVFRFKENIKMSGTAAVILAETGFITSTIMVFASDYNNTPAGYTKGTDFTATEDTGSIARIGGDIDDGETVIVEYNQTATCKRIAAGGLLPDFEAALKLVHYCEDGKIVQFDAYRAKKIGASDIAIQMAAEFGGIAMTFHILADLSKTPGKQLFTWSKEA